ncbi:MAG: hypothetical protein FJX76_08125 [Armatimonadetes bacterium]|nr:hypothetical protein [Armatimonadota bacterium]
MSVKTEKARTFQSGLTRQATMLAAAPALVAGLLIWSGLYYLDKFPGASHFGLLLVMSVLPLLFGVAILVVMVLTLMKNTGKRVTITKDSITYEHGPERFAVRWEMLAFSAPPAGKKMMRAISISDGANYARIEELFFPDFDALLQMVTAGKQRKLSAIEL